MSNVFIPKNPVVVALTLFVGVSKTKRVKMSLETLIVDIKEVAFSDGKIDSGTLLPVPLLRGNDIFLRKIMSLR